MGKTCVGQYFGRNNFQSFKKCGITNSLNELENGDIDEIIDEIVDKENNEILIEMHENLDNTTRLQAR